MTPSQKRWGHVKVAWCDVCRSYKIDAAKNGAPREPSEAGRVGKRSGSRAWKSPRFCEGLEIAELAATWCAREDSNLWPQESEAPLQTNFISPKKAHNQGKKPVVMGFFALPSVIPLCLLFLCIYTCFYSVYRQITVKIPSEKKFRKTCHLLAKKSRGIVKGSFNPFHTLTTS